MYDPPASTSQGLELQAYTPGRFVRSWVETNLGASCRIGEPHPSPESTQKPTASQPCAWVTGRALSLSL